MRENTSFAEFPICDSCSRESGDPDGRQSGSPSTSCPDCGPQYWIEPAPPIASRGDLVYEVSQLLRAGEIIAIKDQRSFRLLARADDDALLKRLHRRQEWRGAPTGLMVRDLAMARRVAILDAESEAQLQTVSSPRLIVRLRSDAPVAARIRELGEIELMLAPESVYEILFADLADDTGTPLLAIPAQVGVDAPVRDNEEARRILRDVADFLVLHDLVLFPCTEDWVLRVVDSAPVVLKRSGADTDCPLPIPGHAPQVLGLGCRTEATAAISVSKCIRMGPWVGELDSERAVAQFGQSARRLLELFDGHPEYVAFDSSSRAQIAPLLDSIDAVPIAVDHHHAHVAAVMAEHGIIGPVLGLSLDGLVQQIDGELGRGVILSGTAADTRLLEALPGFRIPAANFAARDAWRTAMGMIHDLLGAAAARDWSQRLEESPDALRASLSMLHHGVDCSRVESFGCTLSGLAEIIQGPYAPSQSQVSCPGRLAGPVRDFDPASFPGRSLRPGALLGGIVAEVVRRSREQRPASDTAAWAITALTRGVAFRVADLARQEGLDVVVAGGGGLGEPWVRHVLRRTLEEEGLELYLNRSMPCGDAGIALGQVWSMVARGF